MKMHASVAALLLLMPVFAYASCDSVKSDIDGKLKVKNLSSYTLTVIPADQAPQDGKVVGQCEGDKQIVYARGGNGDAVKAPAQNGSTDQPTPANHTMPPASASSSGE